MVVPFTENCALLPSARISKQTVSVLDTADSMSNSAMMLLSLRTRPNPIMPAVSTVMKLYVEGPEPEPVHGGKSFA